ncbi:MAG: AraC family transcriptional regulator [Porticoccaceae bacterium]|nr:AraC family transcriptional regulator [Porticoccaceae bacterium]
MNTVLFNFHDLILIITAFECVLFAALLGAISAKNLKTLFFAGFLLCHALIPIQELVFWGESFRIWVLEISPNIFFLGGYAYFVEGALLFLFVKSLLIKDFTIDRRSLYHLLPLLIYIFHMVYSFYALSHAEKTALIHTQHIAYSAPYLYFDALGRFIRLFYAFACILIILRYTQLLKQSYGTLQHTTLIWLKIIVISMLALFGLDASLLALKLYYLQIDNFNLDLLEIFGTSAYHLSFIVLNLLIFLKFSIFRDVELVEDIKYEDPSAGDRENVNPALVSKIEKVMQETKIYCNVNLTLNDLSAAVEIPFRKLSQIIKAQYHKNFYEFVNAYRIEEAKRMLKAPEYRYRTIMEVYLDAGFNSKSVFNEFFKNAEKMTPSQYKKLNESRE